MSPFIFFSFFNLFIIVKILDRNCRSEQRFVFIIHCENAVIIQFFFFFFAESEMKKLIPYSRFFTFSFNFFKIVSPQVIFIPYTEGQLFDFNL